MTPNNMTYGDTARYPLYIHAYLRTIRYWLKITGMSEKRYWLKITRMSEKRYWLKITRMSEKPLPYLDERGKSN